jgi:hypothetical protein
VGITVLVALVLVAVWWLWPRPVDPTTKPASAGAPKAEDPNAKRASGPGRAWGDAAWKGKKPEEAHPRAHVTCALPEQLPSEGARVRAWYGDRPGPGGRLGGSMAFAGAKITGRGARSLDLAIPIPPTDLGEIQGRIDSPGAGRVEIHVRLDGQGGTCEVGPYQGFAYVSGKVLGASNAEVFVFGCGGHATTDSSGAFYMEVTPEKCELSAMRSDGAFRVRSPSVPVDPRAGAEITLDLSLPAFRAAGVGTQIQAEDGGVRLVKVYPGTPAEQAGLVGGDLVIALDGEDVSGLDADEFIDRALGPEGSQVTYTVLRDGAPVDVVMTRRPMDAPPAGRHER